MKHFLLAAFLIALVKGDRSNFATNLTPHSHYPRTQNARLFASASDRVLNAKRSPIAFPQPEFNFPQLGDQFLQSLQQSENDVKGNYGVPAPQIRQNNNYNQDSYKHQELEEESEEEDSPEKLNSYGVKSAYESPQQSQPVSQNNGQNVVQNVKYLSGFVPSFGPPTKSPQDIPQTSNAHYEHVKEDGSKIFKHVSVHVAPESISTNREPRIIKAQGPREKHYNIIFVKAPEGLVQDTEVHLQPPPQQKTVVYVLAKDQEQKSNIKLATPAPTQVSAPEVYFVRYKDEKNGKISLYEKESPTYGPPMQNAYFPLTSPTPTTFAALTFPTINSVYQTEEALPYSVPVLSPATSYSTPPNSYVTVNPTFAPTVFSTLSPTSQTTTAFGTPLTLFQSLTLEEIGTPPNSLRQQTTSSQFSQNILQNIQENSQNQPQQYSQENPENQQKQQYQNQFQQENHQQQQQVHQQLENSQQQNNNNNFQPSRLIVQEFRTPAPVQQSDQQQQQQYSKPVQEQQREYQLVQPPPSQQGDYQIVQANPPQQFHISLPNHHFQTPVAEQSGEYSSTTITATKAQQSEEDEHFPLVFEATRTTSRLNQENNSESEKKHTRKRKVKRGRKRMRKVKKSRKNKNKEQNRNHNQH